MLKFSLKILLTCLIFAVAGITSLHAGTKLAEPNVNPTPIADVRLTDNELIAIASQAHKDTVQLFTQAFEDDLFHDSKPDWQEIRPQLTNYWSDQIIDNDLKNFYNNHLQEWGYEMGFAFPLWQLHAIESVTIVSSCTQKVIAEFKAPTNYNTIE
ncbi:MAG: hypothetical protein GX922_09200, partial [Firmicutes bacterium]|nr:hypothetical protein [Bacillota bacterium]